MRCVRWSKLETAEIYIREAQKRVMAENAFARLDEYRAGKVSQFSRPTKHMRQIEEKSVTNQVRIRSVMGPAGLEPATRPL